MRSEGLSVCLCPFVKSHLTSGASVCPENAVTYLTGNEGQNVCGIFPETASLRRCSTPSVVRPYVQVAIFHARAVIFTYRLIRAYHVPAHVRMLAHMHRGFAITVLQCSLVNQPIYFQNP